MFNYLLTLLMIVEMGLTVYWAPATVPILASTVVNPPIGAIQGTGFASPFIGETVTFAGVVTGIREERNSQGVTFYTIFVQDLPRDADNDPMTSDGIAVFSGNKRPFVQVGNYILVQGTVTEFYGLTEIDHKDLEITLLLADMPLPEPIPLTLPAANSAQIAYLEAFEAMRVSLPGTTQVVGPTHAGCAFAVARPELRMSHVHRPSETAPIGHVIPILHHTNVTCDSFPVVKNGDQIEGIQGPLTYHFDQFKIVQMNTAVLQQISAPLRLPEIPPQAANGQFSVATFNMENYFDQIDDTKLTAEPKPTIAELTQKQTKLTFALTHTLGCPTIVAVQEVEKQTLLADLASLATETCGFTYEIIHHESPDSRGIDVALLVDPRLVTITHSQLVQTCTAFPTDTEDSEAKCGPDTYPLFSRPPLQVEVNIVGQPITLLVNHFKSKRGDAQVTAQRRELQARHVNQLVQQIPASNQVIVLGDFNDYENSAAQQVLGQYLHNILHEVPTEERYTFIFSGAAQLIDGIYVTPALAEQMVTVTIQHVNADFPDAWQTNTTTSYLPYKATDHDLPLAIFDIALQKNVLNEAAHPDSTTPLNIATAEPEVLKGRSKPDSPHPFWPNSAILLLASSLSITLLVRWVWFIRKRKSDRHVVHTDL